jgi:RsiW-degrading membrane proteinase PrsW (M82 family)
MFFAVVWGLAFKILILRDSGDWKLPFAAMLFTGIIGTNVLLTVYQMFFPKMVLEWAFSANPFVSLFGCVGPVGLCEEFCKIAPVVAYVAWRRAAAKPLTMVLIGVFSGLGFSAFENLRYDDAAIANSYDLAVTYGPQGLSEGVQVAMVVALARSLSCVFMHAVMSGLFAYFLAAAWILKRAWGAFFLVGFGIVGVLHGACDWLAGLQPTIGAFAVGGCFLLFCTCLTRLRGMISTTPQIQTPINDAVVPAADDRQGKSQLFQPLTGGASPC